MFTFFKKKKSSSTATPPPEPISDPSPAPAEAPAAEVSDQPRAKGWLQRIKAGLQKTRAHFEQLFRRPKLSATDIEQLEEALILADCGVSATNHLIETVKTRFQKNKEDITSERLHHYLTDALVDLITPLEKNFVIPDTHHPHMITLVGVNGAGKTTTIGKLTHYLQSQQQSVLLAAGDTFRAAAQEQLQAWGERNDVTVIRQDSGDPASVIYDAIDSAQAKGIDVVIADTAGRLPTQKHLLAELQKIQRVIHKKHPATTHEVILIVDGTSGQNVLSQLRIFHEAVPLTGLIVTKLDGTAKGGIIAAIAHQSPHPIYFLGVGEKKEDLIPFQARAFAAAMLGE